MKLFMLDKSRKNWNGVVVTQLDNGNVVHPDLGEISKSRLCSMMFTRKGDTNNYRGPDYFVTIDEIPVGNYI